MIKSANSGMKAIFNFTNALYYMYYNMHWKSAGTNYYGDHLLFQRLYEDEVEEIDQLAEKTLGVFLDQGLLNPAQDLANAAKVLSEFFPQDMDPKDFAFAAIAAEKKFLELIDEVLEDLEEEDQKTNGIDNLLQGIADKHEEHLYLLQQRAMPKEAMSVGARLYKVAYALDKRGMYSEAKEIEELMAVMAKRVGLNLNDMVALADYFDQEGEKALANKFDLMVKEAVKKK